MQQIQWKGSNSVFLQWGVGDVRSSFLKTAHVFYYITPHDGLMDFWICGFVVKFINFTCDWIGPSTAFSREGFVGICVELPTVT